jgi:hypothetical protein
LAHLEHKSNAYRDQIEELGRELEDDVRVWTEMCMHCSLHS